MKSPTADRSAGTIISDAVGFLRGFATYAGRRAILGTALVMFGAFLEGISLAFLVPLLGIVIGSGLSNGRLEQSVNAVIERFFGAATPIEKLSVILVFFGIIIIIRAVVISWRNLIVADLQVGFVESRRARIAELVASAPWSQLVDLRHARITHLIGGDIQRVGAGVYVLLNGIVAIATLLVQCALVFLLAPVMGFVALGLLLVTAIIFVPIARRAYRLGEVVVNANLSLIDTTAQFLGGLKLAVSQNLQSRFVGEFRRSLQELRRRQISFMRQQTNTSLALSTMFSFLGASLLLIGFWFSIGAPTLLTLLLIMTRMGSPIGQLQAGFQQLANVLPIYRKTVEMEHLLAALPREAAAPQANAPALDGSVAFENVTYMHSEADGETPRGVHGLSLTIAAGEIVGIAGPSGAGKTTFADMLVGLMPPQEGRILVSGHALEGATLAAWRDAISYVSQDPFLFHDTVRKNFVWASPDVTEDEMWQALTLAGADALVRRMEHGLDTVLGERGTLVSGGERQRIALARAILRKPRLLILDEATNALDPASEQNVLGRLQALKPRPTIVMIAHRPDSLTHCDRIIRLEGGRISYPAG